MTMMMAMMKMKKNKKRKKTSKDLVTRAQKIVRTAPLVINLAEKRRKQ